MIVSLRIELTERILDYTMYKKKIILNLLITVLLFISQATPALAREWQKPMPGIEYRDLATNPLIPWAHIHVFRIDLNQYQLDLFSAKELSHKQASIDVLAHKSKALIAINGGFFDQKFRPLGLRVKQKRVYNPIKRISWWGIFYITNKQPHIISSHEYSDNIQSDVAIQSGPRLIIDGYIPHLKPGFAERSALGITKNNKVIILVTDNAMLTTTELATVMKSKPLNCQNALNLDGGSSSQLFAQVGRLQLNVHGFSNVSDAIVIKKNLH